MTQVSGNSTRGKPAKAMASYIQTALTQLTHAAARAKETYLSTFYQRLAAAREKTGQHRGGPREGRQCLP
jgi:hypothetical protein